MDQMPIGQGPFRLVSRAQDDRTVVERNEDYWQGTDNIYLDGIEFLPITDTAIAAERGAELRHVQSRRVQYLLRSYHRP